MSKCNLYSFCCALLVIFVCASGLSCGRNQKQKDVNLRPVLPLETDSVIVLDSVIKDGFEFYVSANIQFAKSGEKETVRNINSWIYSSLCPGDYLLNPPTDFDSIIKNRKILLFNNQEVQNFYSYGRRNNDNYSFNGFYRAYYVSVEYENNKYITFRFVDDSGCGQFGHVPKVSYVTFRKKDGERMGWKLIPDTTDRKEFVKNRIINTFLPSGSFEELVNRGIVYADTVKSNETSFVVDLLNYPLPNNNEPFLLKEGVALYYEVGQLFSDSVFKRYDAFGLIVFDGNLSFLPWHY